VRINTQEYSWEISTLESLLTKWRDECSPKSFRNRDIKLLLVAVNNTVIPASHFSPMPISDGDEITIVAGMIAGG
jgi:thiamine biosynthesis protein ThiS